MNGSRPVTSNKRPRNRDMGVVDYTLAKRALLRDFRQGLLSRLEICDAHPELLRAGGLYTELYRTQFATAGSGTSGASSSV